MHTSQFIQKSFHIMLIKNILHNKWKKIEHWNLDIEHFKVDVGKKNANVL